MTIFTIGRAALPAAATALLLGAVPATAQKGVDAGYVGSPGVTLGGGGSIGGGLGGGFRGGGIGGGFKGVGPNHMGPAGVTFGGGGLAGRGLDRPGFYGGGRGVYGRGYGFNGRGYGLYGRGYGYGGYGLGLGLAAGGLYGAYGYPGYGYDDGYYGPGYAPAGYAPVATEVEIDAGDDASAAYARRFRTYDARTGTYVGKGGVRRACP